MKKWPSFSALFSPKDFFLIATVEIKTETSLDQRLTLLGPIE